MHGDLGLVDQLLFVGPLWLIALILIVASLLAREAGSLLYKRLETRRPATAEGESEDAQSHIVGAVFGLLAFIIAFTFSIAIDRYDIRRNLVAEEANAIEVAYRRASLFDEPSRSQIQANLRAYARTRVAPSGLWDDAMEAKLRQARLLRAELWEETRTAVYPIRTTTLAASFVEAMDHVLDVGILRELAGRAHVPTRILDVTLLYLIVASGMLGYVLKVHRGGRRKASTVMLVLFVIVITLILDVDRPDVGSVRVPQRAMEDLIADLDRDAARASAAVPTPADRP